MPHVHVKGSRRARKVSQVPMSDICRRCGYPLGEHEVVKHPQMGYVVLCPMDTSRELDAPLYGEFGTSARALYPPE